MRTTSARRRRHKRAGAATMNLDDVLRQFSLHSVNLDERTLVGYRSIVRQVNRWAGRVVSLKELDAELILRFMHWQRERGRQPKTANNSRAALLRLWRFAKRQGYTDRRPPDAEDLPKFKVIEKIPEAWSVEQVGLILKACRNARPLPYWYPEHWVALVKLLYDTAWRLKEAMSLRVDDLQGQWATIRDSKTNKEDTKKLAPDTVEDLLALPPHASGKFFNWPQHERQLWIHFGAILGEAGLAPNGHRGLDKFHKLRRTSSTHLCAAKGMAVAEQHLGHKTPGLAAKSYVDPRFIPSVEASDYLPRP